MGRHLLSGSRASTDQVHRPPESGRAPGAAETRIREKSEEANPSTMRLPSTQKATLTMVNTRQSLKNKDRHLQEERRRQDKSAGVCVMLLQSFSCPVEPFQHQQSPGQKTNLASQGLSVKDGCLGCRGNWDGLLASESEWEELSPRLASEAHFTLPRGGG